MFYADSLAREGRGVFFRSRTWLQTKGGVTIIGSIPFFYLRLSSFLGQSLHSNSFNRLSKHFLCLLTSASSFSRLINSCLSALIILFLFILLSVCFITVAKLHIIPRYKKKIGCKFVSTSYLFGC